jgi:hypothetical protein
MSRYNEKAWRTMNWLRFGSEVFMVQQRWELHEIENSKSLREKSYGYAAMTPFPTDNWRIVNLKDVVDDDDLRKVMEARPDAGE